MDPVNNDLVAAVRAQLGVSNNNDAYASNDNPEKIEIQRQTQLEIVKEAAKYVHETRGRYIDSKLSRVIKAAVDSDMDEKIGKHLESITDEVKNAAENKLAEETSSMMAGVSDQVLSIIKDQAESQVAAKADQYLGEQLEDLKDKIDEQLEIVRSTQVQTLDVTINGQEANRVAGITHELFPTIIKFIANRQHIYLWGPSGAGKNVMVEQIAKALGLQFRSLSTITDPWQLTGFLDANSNYKRTAFREAWEHGGVIFLDELDASTPEVMLTINGALSSGYLQFPDTDELVYKHDDCIIVAGGNTNGSGATSQFNGRSKMDNATLDRFAVFHFDYSTKIEESLCQGERDKVSVLKVFNNIRRDIKNLDLELVVSTRALANIFKNWNTMKFSDLLNVFVFKGLEQDVVNKVLEKSKALVRDLDEAVQEDMD